MTFLFVLAFPPHTTVIPGDDDDVDCASHIARPSASKGYLSLKKTTLLVAASLHVCINAYCSEFGIWQEINLTWMQNLTLMYSAETYLLLFLVLKWCSASDARWKKNACELF